MIATPKIILGIRPLAGGRDFMRGVFKYSHLYGPWFFYSEPEEEQLRKLPLPKNWDANAIITDTQDKTKTKAMLATGLPIVIFQGQGQLKSEGSINVIGDCPEVGKIAAEHFLARGFQHFAFCGFEDYLWSQTRRDNFSKTVDKAGFETSIFQRPRSRLKSCWKKELLLMINWLKSLPKPVGIMACNDDYARNLLQACRMTELRVPEKVAVIGVDNDEWFCNISAVPLSSIVRNTERAGYEAAEMLDRLMAGKKMASKDIMIKALHVETRKSTDILAIEDDDVVEAVQFIREHAKEMIQVNDVAEAVGLSRRSLYNRFYNALGCTVYAEIRRVRINLITRMLVETSLSISQIAFKMGYMGTENAKHIARYFRKEKGISLVEYRKRYGSK